LEKEKMNMIQTLLASAMMATMIIAASLPHLEPGQSMGIALGIPAAPNFRDVGGYVTADGLTVARGLVYRSGVFYPMSPEAMSNWSPWD
jgi:hypothetical protein